MLENTGQQVTSEKDSSLDLSHKRSPKMVKTYAREAKRTGPKSTRGSKSRDKKSIVIELIHREESELLCYYIYQ